VLGELDVLASFNLYVRDASLRASLRQRKIPSPELVSLRLLFSLLSASRTIYIKVLHNSIVVSILLGNSEQRDNYAAEINHVVPSFGVTRTSIERQILRLRLAIGT
jgi:hypothetical protein